MALSDEQEHLEALKRQLYGRSSDPQPIRRSSLSGFQRPGNQSWPHVESLAKVNSAVSLPLLKKLSWIAGGLFVLMTLLAGFIFFRGQNLISAGNVDVRVTGPAEIAAGETLSLQVSVSNQNQATLELADLIVEYPPGSRMAGAVATPISRERLPLGDITPGETANRTVKAVIFGEKGSSQELRFTIEYRLANSSAIFDKQANYKVGIASTPLAIVLDLPREVNSRQEIVLEAEIRSNSESEISDPVVMFNYPPGFRFISAIPAPTRNQNIWSLASLRPGKKADIEIRGTLEGQDEEEKSFRISAGTMERETDDELSATYGSALETVTIKRPYVGLDVQIGGSATPQVVANSRESILAEVAWLNNTTDEILDGEISVKLSGQVLDKTSVAAGRGYFNSGSGTVLWNKINLPALGRVMPGEGANISFNFSTVSLLEEGAGLRQPALDLEVQFKGRRISGDGKTEAVFSTAKRQVKFNSVAQFAAKALQRSGSFINRGPLPPKVGEETTYTIVWSVLNSSNNLENARVTASLPPYVRWLGISQPLAETVRFNGESTGGGEVIWELGPVNSGVGTGAPAREISFQVALRPSVGQVGTAPKLLLQPVFSGVDSFTGATLSATLKRELDTQLLADPQFQLGEERVIP